MTRKRVRVVAALFRRGDEVLVQQRGPGEARALLWEFPGGKVERDETDEAALARECREELGVEIEVGRPVTEIHHAYADLEVDLALYASHLVDGEPQALHAHAVRWVSIGTLDRLPFCEADGPFVRGLARGDF